MFENPPAWELETMVTGGGAFSVSIGCSQRSSGAFEERREAALERKVRSDPGGGLTPSLPGQPPASPPIQNIGVRLQRSSGDVLLVAAESLAAKCRAINALAGVQQLHLLCIATFMKSGLSADLGVIRGLQAR